MECEASSKASLDADAFVWIADEFSIVWCDKSHSRSHTHNDRYICTICIAIIVYLKFIIFIIKFAFNWRSRKRDTNRSIHSQQRLHRDQHQRRCMIAIIIIINPLSIFNCYVNQTGTTKSSMRCKMFANAFRIAWWKKKHKQETSLFTPGVALMVIHSGDIRISFTVKIIIIVFIVCLDVANKGNMEESI